MAWIEFHQELRDLAKVARLARLLHISYPTALGHLSCVWLWAVGNARDGRLERFSDEEIAYGGRWEGPASKFRSALRTAGWIDADRALHDWDKHGLRLLNSARDRMAKHRIEQLQNRAVTASKRESKQERRKETANPSADFERFWSAYPRRVCRADALKAWAKLAPDKALIETIVQAVAMQKRWPQWIRDGGQFIPHPSTWLRGRRWEDQPPTEAAMVAGGAKPRSVADELSLSERTRLKALTSQVGRAA